MPTRPSRVGVVSGAWSDRHAKLIRRLIASDLSPYVTGSLTGPDEDAARQLGVVAFPGSVQEMVRTLGTRPLLWVADVDMTLVRETAGVLSGRDMTRARSSAIIVADATFMTGAPFESVAKIAAHIGRDRDIAVIAAGRTTDRAAAMISGSFANPAVVQLVARVLIA